MSKAYEAAKEAAKPALELLARRDAEAARAAEIARRQARAAELTNGGKK